MDSFLTALSNRLRDHVAHKPYNKDVCDAPYVFGADLGLTKNQVTWIFINFEIGDTENEINGYLRDPCFSVIYPNG